MHYLCIAYDHCLNHLNNLLENVSKWFERTLLKQQILTELFSFLRIFLADSQTYETHKHLDNSYA